MTKLHKLLSLIIVNFVFCLFLNATDREEMSFHYSPDHKIAFFGASVTAQKEPQGYVGEFKKLHNPDLVYQFGYPSQSITCKGLVSIDQVLSVQPNIIFFDFFLCLNPHAHVCIDRIHDAIMILESKCYFENCLPIFLLFDNCHDPRKKDVKYYEQMQVYQDALSKNESNVLDLQIFEPKYLDTLLRDKIHCNELGAKIYAFHIKKYLESYSGVLKKKKVPVSLIPFMSIKSMIINKDFFKYFQFKIKGFIIGIQYILGPYSNFIEIKDNNGFCLKKLIWDSYCHYERGKTDLLNFQEFDGFVEFRVLNDDFDRNSCRGKVDWNWKELTPKFKLQKIFYTGELTDFKGE